MNEQQLQEVYQMVDGITFSRNKRNINRDFSDGMMMAELIHHYNPKIISVHNYPTTNSVAKKIQNWKNLNTKILKKIGITLSKQEIENIANAVPNAIELILYQILLRFQKTEEEGRLSLNAKKFQKSEAGIRLTNKTPESVEEGGTKFFKKEQGNKQWIQKEIDVKRQKVVDKNKQFLANREQAEQLLDKIQKAYFQLSKLSQMNKVKEQMVLNLQKKLEKALYA